MPAPAPRSLLPLLVLLGAAACTSSLGSRRWGLPDTEVARSCQAECEDIRGLCARRPTAGDLATDVTRPGAGSLPVHTPPDDERRHRACEDTYEDCVGRCPGAFRR